MEAHKESRFFARLPLGFILAAVLSFAVVAAFLLAIRDDPVSIQTNDGTAIDQQAAVTPALAPPELTQPVNDFANVIGFGRREIERAIESLFLETEDVIVVATVQTVAPFSDIRDYSAEMFKNRGRGIGAAGKDNGILVLLAVDDRQVRITTGLGIERVIPDTLAAQIAGRMIEYFRRGEIDAGLLAGINDLAAHIRDERKR